MTNYPVGSPAASQCEFCGEQRGWGSHEEYCSENPANLARHCYYSGCKFPGNHITDHGSRWICDVHSELECATEFLRSRKNSVRHAIKEIDRIQEELKKAEQELPIAEQKYEEAKWKYEQTKFKAKLIGIE